MSAQSSMQIPAKEFPGKFRFAKPKTTTPGEAKRKLGKPSSDYLAYVVGNEIDVRVGPRDPWTLERMTETAKKKKTKLERVRVMEWRPTPKSRMLAKLVFRQDKLWYAVFPPPAGESTIQKVENRYGRKPRKSAKKRQVGKVRIPEITYVYPDLGVGYVQTGKELGLKVVFPKRAAPGKKKAKAKAKAKAN